MFMHLPREASTYLIGLGYTDLNSIGKLGTWRSTTRKKHTRKFFRNNIHVRGVNAEHSVKPIQQEHYLLMRKHY